MDPGWDPGGSQADKGAPVVVLVHGFNSTPQRSSALLSGARSEGLPCGSVAYPNDQPIRQSAELLSAELKAFAKRCPTRNVTLLTHSMGGLVARECLESAELDPGNVRRLIMVAPPTHGSMLARYAVGWDLWEHWVSRRKGNPWARTRESLVDGLGEAPRDLLPGSKFLTRLNSRPRNPDVQYTLLLGSVAKLSDEQRFAIRESLRSMVRYTPGVAEDVDAIDRFLAKMDEVVDGRGDGAVAISRGRLEGVADTHVLPFSHLSVIRDPASDEAALVQDLIVQRILAADGA
jgi:pimeloyl-ACP methyl ester carboxylesterase